MRREYKNVTIGDIADVKGGKRLPRGKLVQDEVTDHPYIRVTDFGDYSVDRANIKYIDAATYNAVKQYIITTDDIYISIAGTIGLVGIIPPDLSNANLTENAAKICQIDPSVNKHYLLYYLHSYYGQGQIKSKVVGTSQPKLALFRIKEIEFPCPPLLTQRKIAAILSAYDDLIENNTRRIAILEEMAQSLYREWFMHFRFPGHEKNTMVESPLGMIPDGWEVVRFTDIADVLSGGTPKTTTAEYWNGDIPFFSPRDASSSFYVLETEKHITKSGLKACSSKLYPKNTIFITARGTVGKVLLSSVDMAMNQSCYALQGKDSIGQYFVFMIIKNCIDQLKQNAHGAVFDTIIVDTFKMLQVIKPEQTFIDEFSRVISPLFEQMLNLMNKNVNLRGTRDLLLPKLISGELDVEGLDIEVGDDAGDASNAESVPMVEPEEAALRQDRFSWETGDIVFS